MAIFESMIFATVAALVSLKAILLAAACCPPSNAIIGSILWRVLSASLGPLSSRVSRVTLRATRRRAAAQLEASV